MRAAVASYNEVAIPTLKRGRKAKPQQQQQDPAPLHLREHERKNVTKLMMDKVPQKSHPKCIVLAAEKTVCLPRNSTHWVSKRVDHWASKDWWCPEETLELVCPDFITTIFNYWKRSSSIRTESQGAERRRLKVNKVYHLMPLLHDDSKYRLNLNVKIRTKGDPMHKNRPKLKLPTTRSPSGYLWNCCRL